MINVAPSRNSDAAQTCSQGRAGPSHDMPQGEHGERCVLDDVMKQSNFADCRALQRQDDVVKALEPLIDGIVRLIEQPTVWPAQHSLQG